MTATTSSIRPPAIRPVRWTEDLGKLALWQRAQADTSADVHGRCEGCGQSRPLDPSHRVRKGQGGLWAPANLIALCRPCHDWLHDHEGLAAGLGWVVDPRTDPETVPAWILTPGGWSPSWYQLTYLLDADGVPQHVVRPVHAEWIA